MKELESIVSKLLTQYSHADIKKALKSSLATMPKIEVVINGCYGGFSLSQTAIDWIKSNYPNIAENDLDNDDLDNDDLYNDDLDNDYWIRRNMPRNHEALVAVVKTLGTAANGQYASLYIAEVPTGSDWSISEYDGCESVRW